MQVLVWFGLAFNDVHQYISTPTLKPASPENVVFRALKITSMPSARCSSNCVTVELCSNCDSLKKKWREFLVPPLRTGDDGIKTAFENTLNLVQRVNKKSVIYYQA